MVLPICLALVWALGASPDVPQAVQAETRSEHQGLAFRIELAKTSYVLYEPMSVRVRVVNQGTTPIATTVLQNPRPPYLEVFVTNREGQASGVRRGARVNVAMVVRPLEPGIELSEDVEVHWNAATKDWAFPAAGEYQVHARLFAGFEEMPYMESNRIRVTVKRPEGVDTEAIASFESEKEFARLLQDGPPGYCRGRTGSTCYEDIERFLRDFGTSAYAPIVTWNLAESIDAGLIDGPPGKQTAIVLLRRFLEKWPADATAPRVMYSLAFKLEHAGHSRDAAALVQEFKRKYPDRKKLIASLQSNLGLD